MFFVLSGWRDSCFLAGQLRAEEDAGSLFLAPDSFFNLQDALNIVSSLTSSFGA